MPLIYIHLKVLHFQTITKLLSHLEKNDFFIPPSPRVNVALEKVGDRDATRDSATFCGTATLIRGEGGKHRQKN